MTAHSIRRKRGTHAADERRATMALSRLGPSCVRCVRCVRRGLRTALAPRWLWALAASASLLGAPAAIGNSANAPDDAVAQAKLVYRTSGTFRLAGVPMTLHARTVTDWHLDGQRYQAHLHMDTVDFDQFSEGSVGPEGVLAPDHYTEKRPFHGPEAVVIDWANRTVRFANAGPVPAPGPGAQDRLSLQFELARMRQRHPEGFAPGSLHDVKLMGTHDVDPWTFTVADEELVDTGLGSTRAIRCSARRKVGAVEETIDVWLGVDQRSMPVRIKMVDRNGSIIDSVLQSVEFP